MKPEDIKPWKIKRSEYLVKRPWLTARRDVVDAPNPGSMSNMQHCFLATGVEPTGTQHLDATEDLAVFTATRDEVVEMMHDGRIFQALMLAPLYKYLYEMR